MDFVKTFERVVEVFETGGPYAIMVLFVWLWWRLDKRYTKAVKDLRDIALSKLENDVKTERTLSVNARALEDISMELRSFDKRCEAVRNALEKVLLLQKSDVKIEE